MSIEDVGLSDHNVISCSTDMSSSAPKHITTSTRPGKNFNRDELKKELLNSELCTRTDDDADIKPESVDKLVKKYHTIVIYLLDKAAPVANLTIRESYHQPWFDSDSQATRREVRRLERDSSRNEHPKHEPHGGLLYVLLKRTFEVQGSILLKGEYRSYRQRLQECMEDRKFVAWRDENKM